MKVRFAALLVVVACLLAPRHAGAITTDELLQSCHAVTASGAVRAGATLEIPAAGLPCWYYMSAMQNMAVLVDESGTRFLGVCPPADSTVMDFVRIFVQHARKHRRRRTMPRRRCCLDWRRRSRATETGHGARRMPGALAFTVHISTTR